MKPLILIAITLAMIFGTTFFIMTSNGILTVEVIERLFDKALNINKAILFFLVVIVLFADLFVAIPTMSVCILSGLFLGFPLGFMSALLGTMSAGIVGFLISRKYGRTLLRKIYKEPEKIAEMELYFYEKGAMVILLCRAMPMLPEISCCLAGANNMRFGRFFLLFSIATIPYVLITTISGSYSTFENPNPAIYAAIFISLTLWGAWYVFFKLAKTSNVRN